MRTGKAVLILGVFLPLLPMPSHAQKLQPPFAPSPLRPTYPRTIRLQETPVAPGDRVRIRAVETDVGGVTQRTYVGNLLGIEAETFRLERENQGSLVSLPTSAMRSLEVSRGTRGSGVWGAVIGAAGAFLLAQLIPEQENMTPGGDWTPVLGLGLVAVGGGAGAIVGSRVKRDRWEEIPLDRLNTSLTGK